MPIPIKIIPREILRIIGANIEYANNVGNVFNIRVV